ncbi:hypothetical protein CY0110_19537 [Crocosphaera chwakensis CCY0110]|uniref:Uncharacterized protein n=1 Tax=Crocosphaera chwakensis CCY0110 TaxID=391612 RepID=A3IJN9_9CHRO|nr:hypothetical protein CY0110_19537 [Crocosphaera chwakensis CCY0110]
MSKKTRAVASCCLACAWRSPLRRCQSLGVILNCCAKI